MNKHRIQRHDFQIVHINLNVTMVTNCIWDPLDLMNIYEIVRRSLDYGHAVLLLDLALLKSRQVSWHL